MPRVFLWCVHLPSDPNIMKSDSRAMSSTANEMLLDNVENGDHTTVAVLSSMDFQRPRWVIRGTKSVTLKTSLKSLVVLSTIVNAS